MYVLVIDDDPMIRKTAEFLLTDDGFEVGVAASGAAAAEMVEMRQPDLFVLDLVLPDVDGFEIYRRLQEANADAMILFLTPRGWVDDCTEGLELNTGTFLQKPFSPEEFIARVNSLALRCLSAGRDGIEERIRVGSAELRVKDSRLVLSSGNISRLVNLTLAEVSLLRLLMVNAGKVVPENVLRDGVPHMAAGCDRDRETDTHLVGLLRKLTLVAPAPRYIESSGTHGYRFNVITA
jgi:DNA-binding response OmpR family regulator